VAKKLDLLYRVAGVRLLDVEAIEAEAAVENEVRLMNRHVRKDRLTERYVNISHSVVPECENIIDHVISFAQNCKQKHARLFGREDISIHEIYCGVFPEFENETTLVWLAPEEIDTLRSLSVGLAISIYQSERT
jgi:hypothetical protein